MRVGLPRRGQRLARERPTCATTCRACSPLPWPGSRRRVAADSTGFADPLAYVNLVAHAHVRDAAVVAEPQSVGRGPDAVRFARGRNRRRVRADRATTERTMDGKFPAYALRRRPDLSSRRSSSIATASRPSMRMACREPGRKACGATHPMRTCSTGGAAGRMPLADARNLYTDIAGNRLADPANRLEPGMRASGANRSGWASIRYPWTSCSNRSGPCAAGRSRPACAASSSTRRPVAHRVRGDAGWRAARLRRRQRRRTLGLDAEGTDWGASPALVRDAPTTVRSHGIDGPLVVHRHDPDGDGRIDPAAGEHLWLLFGLGRGGARYYALDIALPRDPRLLWSVELPDPLALALAEPVVARLDVANSGQDADDWVVVLAGGYDRRFDARGATGAGRGSALLAVDATDGPAAVVSRRRRADLQIAELSSVAAAPRLLDLDGDGQDRPGLRARRRRLPVANRFRRTAATPAHSRRPAGSFASMRPAVAFISRRTRRSSTSGMQDRLAIAMASGALMRPRDATIEDALFVVYDEIAGSPVRELAQSPTCTTPRSVKDGLPPDAPGWFVRLDAHGAGEKIAGPIVTFDHALRFQTYQPLPHDPAAPCGPPRSVARRYAIDIRTALPLCDRRRIRGRTSPRKSRRADCRPASGSAFRADGTRRAIGCKPRPFGILGGETFDTGYSGDPVRTSWRKLVPPPASP